MTAEVPDDGECSEACHLCALRFSVLPFFDCFTNCNTEDWRAQRIADRLREPEKTHVSNQL